ncbi:MAG: dynamin family protein [Eubacteriaceae bacterium]
MMKHIFIKYNPYKLETDISVDGIPVKSNSKLNKGSERLQEWLEDLPEILKDECNTENFKVTFHGTVLDYEDLLAVAKDARDHGITIECEHIPAKEVGDKEAAIDLLFAEIKEGPFDELKQPDIIKAFELAKSSDFEVNVVATMSAGKSTLINALLRQKLMPAKQEACTATITKIKDNNDKMFRATVYGKNDDLIEAHPELNLEIMQALNNNPSVSVIKVEGDIPFVTPEEVALILVDTPGPNNSRDPNHKVATYRMLSESTKALVIYVLNATQLGVEDDSNLLDHVAKSMSIGDKQSKDRFMFIVNKLDDFREGEDSVEDSIENVKKYLEDKGIYNPHIYPAAALPALNIRTLQSDNQNTDKDLRDETELKVSRINRTDMLHLENYAPLTPSVRDKVTAELAKAKESKETYDEALIHTGIIPIELAIQMYVKKYAKTAKVKNIVDTFSKKLESAESSENAKQKIAENQDKQKEILGQIDKIKAKLKSGDEAKKFKEKIDAINYDKEIRAVTDAIIKEAQKGISTQAESSSNKKLSKKEAESICMAFVKFVEELQADIQIKLEDAVTKHIEKNAQDLLNEYKNKIAALASEVPVGNVSVDPFKLMKGDMGRTIDIDSLISSFVHTEEVEDGNEWVDNSDKKWFKPWTWFQEDGYFKTKYKNQEYVDGSGLAQKFFAPIQKQLFDNSDSAVKYAKSKATEVKHAFNKEFDELDKVLKNKLGELEDCATNSKNVETTINKAKERLAWLEAIQKKMADILDI